MWIKARRMAVCRVRVYIRAYMYAQLSRISCGYTVIDVRHAFEMIDASLTYQYVFHVSMIDMSPISL